MVYPRHRNGFGGFGPERWACSSAGEHYVDIVGVTSSILVTPTISFPCLGSGCVAQRESTAFTRQGSQVQSLSHPPFPDMLEFDRVVQPNGGLSVWNAGLLRSGSSDSMESGYRTGNGAEDDRFRLLVDSITDYAIYMLDADGMVTTWNSGAERIKGYKAEEIIGRHHSTFYTAHDCAAEMPELA